MNDGVNKVDFVSNQLVYKKDAYWATEREFFNWGGECRDYAVEKYRLLRRAGVPDANMQIVVGYLKTGELHAILSVTDENNIYVLDNQDNVIRDNTYKLKVIYTLNRIAWRLK